MTNQTRPSVPTDPTGVTLLGLGAMGRALAEALLDAGHHVTVWNRSPGRADGLAGRGAHLAAGVDEAVVASPVAVACLLDHASVHEVLDPVADRLAGRAVINLTTTTPDQARELAAWAASHDVEYLDGGIMATPDMIGKADSVVLYSGSAEVVDTYRSLLDRWGETSYLGDDAGRAALYDLALLSGMYVMFAGFLHGAAMVETAGISPRTFADRATTFQSAMTAAFAQLAEVVDTGDYSVEGRQSLEFSDLGDILRASRDAGVSTEVVEPIQALVRRQIDAGHAKAAFERIYEGLRSERV